MEDFFDWSFLLLKNSRKIPVKQTWRHLIWRTASALLSLQEVLRHLEEMSSRPQVANQRVIDRTQWCNTQGACYIIKQGLQGIYESGAQWRNTLRLPWKWMEGNGFDGIRGRLTWCFHVPQDCTFDHESWYLTWILRCVILVCAWNAMGLNLSK